MNTTTLPEIIWHWLREEECYVVDVHSMVKNWLAGLPIGTEFAVYDLVAMLKDAIAQDIQCRSNPDEYDGAINAQVYPCDFKVEVETVKTPLEYFSDDREYYRRFGRQSDQPLLIHRISGLPELMDEPFDIRYQRI